MRIKMENENEINVLNVNRIKSSVLYKQYMWSISKGTQHFACLFFNKRHMFAYIYYNFVIMKGLHRRGLSSE